MIAIGPTDGSDGKIMSKKLIIIIIEVMTATAGYLDFFFTPA